MSEYVVGDEGCDNLRPRVRPPWCRVAERVSFVGHPSMTQQSHSDQTDVNAIVARFERTGQMPIGNRGQGQYADVTGLQGDLCELAMRSAADIARADDFLKDWKPPEEEKPPEAVKSPVVEPTDPPG